MPSKTLLQLTGEVTALTDRVTALEKRIVALADLEAYVQENRAKIDELDISDTASGWKAWREQQKESMSKDVR